MIHRTLRTRARRARSPLAALLAVAALALTAVGCDAADINARLTDYGDNATAGKLNGGAGGPSVRLADDRVIFLANDVYTGTVNGSGIRSNNTPVDNALMVVADITDPDSPITTKLASDGSAYLKPSNTSNHYHLLSATAGSNDIQVFVAEYNSSNIRVASRVIRLLQSTLLPSGSPVTVPHQASGPEWGHHVIKSVKDNHWYIYGAGATASTYIARAPSGYLAIPSNWEYWTGTSWSDSSTAAGAIRDGSGQVVAKYLTPAYHADASRFVFLGRNGGTGGNTFTFYTATSPSGPVTDPGGTAYTVPAESCGSGGSVYGFGIASHPQISDNQASAVFSYSRRCTVPNTAGVAAVDRPKFFEVDLADAPATPRWRATWAEGLAESETSSPLVDWDYPNGFTAGTSLRQVVHTTRGGSEVRIRLSNYWGTVPLQIGAASVGISDQAAGTTKALDGTPTVVTFAGQPTVTIPVGQTIQSDAIELGTPLPSDHDVAITLYFPAATGKPSVHPHHLETSHVGPGNRTADVPGTTFNAMTDDGYFLTGLDVVDPAAGGTVAAIGDSLTNGWGSTQDAEMRWTDRLYDKLVTGGTPVRTVVNLGISGNQLLPGVTSPNSGLERFQRDVFSSPAVTTVVVWIGFNDIDAGESADDVAEGLQEMIDAIDASGRKVILGTISPLIGSDPGATLDLNDEYQRLLLNAMIRNGDFDHVDGVADIDAAVRDTTEGWRVKAAYSFLGGSHFTHAGNGAIADAVYAKRSLF